MAKAEINALISTLVVILLAIGLALAGSQGDEQVFGIPLFAFCIALTFLIQWIALIPAYIFQSEKFYDLTGSITYIAVSLTAVLLSGKTDPRAYLLLALVLIWAVRLGTFLFTRILQSGKDRRFDEIKPSFMRFLLIWTLQGLWVSFTLAAALAAITSQLQVELGIFAWIGFLIWVFGFGVEVIADQQKRNFRADPSNKGAFIRSGLWSWSRHPNYFGEIVLWVGMGVIAAPVLRGWQWFTMISPVFVYLLLTRISGIPMLEKRANEKWGGQPEYEAYKESTSLLIPLPPSKD